MGRTAAAGAAKFGRLGAAALHAARHPTIPWRMFGAFAFVILAMTVLSIAPYWSARRLEPRRRRVDSVVEPARRLTTRLELGIALQMAGGRAFLLTRDPAFLVGARDALDMGRQAIASLDPLARQLGPDVVARLEVVERLGRRWYAANEGLLPGAVAPAAYLRRIPEQQRRSEELLRATAALEREIAFAGREVQREIRASEGRDVAIAAALAWLALLAALTVGWIFWRQRTLVVEAGSARAEAERRASDEEALRDAAAATAGALGTADVAQRIAQRTLEATSAGGAYIGSLEPDAAEVRVIAVAGEAVPAVEHRFRYAGSPAERALEGRGRAIVVTHRPAAPERAAAADAEGTELIVPLADALGALGVLVLRYAGPRSAPGREARARAATFGELAALALRKGRLLEEAERRGRELERMAENRALLLRGFSHDLKNPLWAADGFLQLLELGVRGPISAAQQECVVCARRSLGAALKLVQDLIELGRAGTGRIEVEATPTDLAGCLRDVVADHRAGAETREIRVHVDIPGELPIVPTDSARVRQIMDNLLSNAIKYTPPGGVVTVRAGLRPPSDGGAGVWLAVDVADSGLGIRSEEQGLVFEEFARVGPLAGVPGAGIGLAISQRVAGALGGRITLQSQEGAGSTFTLWLPLGAA
ncbi:MAG TPA: HAMP domain-containing sensor histidine kinase [Longimicrobiales bacterium]|nr:HAMP domain-containing sensor histidine kinase [Longimicrobiales bacterium]